MWVGGEVHFVSVHFLHNTGCESSFKYSSFCLRHSADNVAFCGLVWPCYLRHSKEYCITFHLQLVGIQDSYYSSDQLLGFMGYIRIAIRVAVVNKETSWYILKLGVVNLKIYNLKSACKWAISDWNNGAIQMTNK